MVLELERHEEPWVARFTLHVQHIAKLDRFLAKAQRAALRAQREFEGDSIDIDARGVVTVHAVGMP
jgi:hypothetical protein